MNPQLEGFDTGFSPEGILLIIAAIVAILVAIYLLQGLRYSK